MSLEVFTATYDRPDIVKIWHRAIKATLKEAHRTTVLHAGDPVGVGDVERSWADVGMPLEKHPQVYTVFKAMPISGPRMFIEEDIIPVVPWEASEYLGAPKVLSGPKGSVWWGFTGYLDGPPRPLRFSEFSLIPQRWVRNECPEWLPKELQQPALDANAKTVGRHFLHIDKISNRHGPNPEKEKLISLLDIWTKKQFA